MLCNLLLVVVIGVVVGHGHGHKGAETKDPVTVTPSGSIKGSWMETRRGRRFQAYRGIRYAEPPVGELRFKAPKPIQQYSGEVDATKEGPACPQPVFDNYPVDEDCLRLNVYTPNNHGSKPLPVLVYMHPGGFYSVSGRSDVAGPHYLLDRDMVLVSINYRLGTLGFLATGDALAPGNNGFKDQVMALRWVQRNIRAFGGDPNMVTIAGYSAGSISVMLHTVSPMSVGLYHRAISMSASPISQVVIGSEQRYLAERQARVLSCPTTTTKDMIDCMKTKTSKEIGDSLDNMFEFGYDPILMWNVVIEPDFGQERFLTMQPLDAIKQGKMNAVPHIISQTRDEFFWKALNVLEDSNTTNTMNSEWERIAPISFLLPAKNSRAAADRLKQAYLGGKALANDSATADGLGKLYGDSVIGFAAHRLANLLCRRSSQPVYYYEFNYIGNHSHYEDPNTGKPTGVAHHDDLIYLFSISASFPTIPTTSPDSQMVDKMTAFFYNFVRYGDPNNRGDTPELGSTKWPVMTPAKRQYMRVDTELSVHEKLFEDRFQVWDELYPIQY